MDQDGTFDGAVNNHHLRLVLGGVVGLLDVAALDLVKVQASSFSQIGAVTDSKRSPRMLQMYAAEAIAPMLTPNSTTLLPSAALSAAQPD